MTRQDIQREGKTRQYLKRTHVENPREVKRKPASLSPKVPDRQARSIAAQLNGKEVHETPKRQKPNQARSNDKRKTTGSTSLMTNEQGEGSPLHDLSYVGVDTCSARSISCNREDFLDLEMSRESGSDDTLRGVGGTNGVAGKGCLIFYAKDLEGKMHAIIEPRGFYLKDPPAKFRILGQQRMKHNGLCITQDYDDAGMDVMKCKRSGTILP